MLADLTPKHEVADQENQKYQENISLLKKTGNARKISPDPEDVIFEPGKTFGQENLKPTKF